MPLSDIQSQTYAKIIDDLHSQWQPHEAQKQIAYAVFYLLKKQIFIECGRKFGKTDILLYILWRFCLLFPGIAAYYIAPFQKQAREIIWADGRIKTFGPSQYLAGKPNDSEMRIRFYNGSFIKLDGSDNHQAYRGITPGLMIYDEYKDFHPEFHIAMEPNLVAKKAPLIIAGTPPEDMDNPYIKVADEIAASLNGAYFNFPTESNPHIDKVWLAEKKAALYARGEGYIWEREYMARRVIGGPSSILPMFSEARHVRPHAEVMAEVLRDRRKLQFYLTTDPGTATVFAALFSAYNPYTQKIYHLAEIYEEEQKNTSTSIVIPKMRDIKQDLVPHWEAMGIDWYQTYDEAATWFSNEANNSFDEIFMPTQKALNKKEDGLSLIKDQMLYDNFVVSDQCTKFVWEIKNYLRDKNGKIPKKNDHLIDCARYTNAAAGLSLKEEKEPSAKHPTRRAFRPSDDFDLREDKPVLYEDESTHDYNDNSDYLED